ncbi:MAG: hypothetical protein ABIP94_04355, partial [Planctomycetota bacterium]
MSPFVGSGLLVALCLSACGGVSHTNRTDLPAPRTVAVLPFGGTADPDVREATRALVQSRLQSAGHRVVEAEWTDRVLSERGWLRDPAGFDPKSVPLAEAIEALGVDAIVVGSSFFESSFNVYLLRRHAFGGTVSLRLPDDTTWWSAEHTASTFGGFLLTSGQVFQELHAQGSHGTPMATLALADEFVSDVAATVPRATDTSRTDTDPPLANLTVLRSPMPGSVQRFVVEATAAPHCILRCELAPLLIGVPMVALPGQPDRFRGTCDL